MFVERPLLTIFQTEKSFAQAQSIREHRGVAGLSPQELAAAQKSLQFTIIGDSSHHQNLIDSLQQGLPIISAAFTHHFWQEIDSYHKQGGKIGERLEQGIKKQGTDALRWQIYFDNQAQDFLDSLPEFKGYKPTGKPLLILNLPPQLSHFYNKRDRGLSGTAVAWRSIYQHVMHQLSHGSWIFSPENTSLYRLNKAGNHLPGKYYYIWEVTPHSPQKGKSAQDLESDYSDDDNSIPIYDTK